MSLRISLVAFVALAACGGTPDTVDDVPGPGAMPSPGDTPRPDVGPSLVSVSPALDAAGVAADSPIVFTFSAPMDGASVAAAYTSEALPAAAVKLSWNDAGDTLTVVPTGGLRLAVGDPSVAALSYQVRIGTEARDRAGRALAAEAVARFTTLRRVSATLSRLAAMSGSVTGSGSISLGELIVGDTSNGVTYRGFVAFPLQSVPVGAQLVEARLTTWQLGVTGTPDADLGQLEARSVTYEALGMEAYASRATADASMHFVPGLNGAPPRRAAVVTSLLAEDLARREQRKDRSLMRLQYATTSNNDGATDRIELDVKTVALDVTYLAR